MLGTGFTYAQTDMTSRIANPSFETNNFDGWVCDGMSCQSNTAFEKKVGTVYAEKWVSQGNKVGNASLMQSLTALPAGTYTVTVAAQNINQGAPTAKQTGMNLIANGVKTLITTPGDYEVTATVVDGHLDLGVVLSGATGNYACVDNFRLTLEEPTAETFAAIHSAMQALVDEANEINKNVESEEQKEFDDACAAVKALMTQDTTEGVAEAMVRLQDAIYDYRLSIASADAAIDMTKEIVNPSFEVNGSAGWTNEGMQSQTNSSFAPKSGSTYMEAWTGGGGSIHDCTLSQTLNLPNGKYVLTASAQCIQQGSNNSAASGGYIFGDDYQTEVGKAGTYSVEVIVLENKMTFGFKTRSAKGNWVAVDNFKLKYQGRSDEMLLDALKTRCEKMEALAASHMNASVLASLNKAVADAKSLANVKNVAQVAAALRESGEAAEKSIAAYASLDAILTKAHAIDANGQDADAFRAAIAKAQSVYDEAAAQEDDIDKAVKALDEAILSYRVANATGEAPEVATVSYVARGATGALGRSIVKGTGIKEKGFCWATHPEPTILDERSTDNYDINGPMYLMQPLKPATVYYVRAYAITNDYAVGYGEVRKVITLPMGNTTYWYNNGGSAEENDRINRALADCIYYYNNWSNTTNFGISCSYGSGTPTADCSYGGSMRVGPNASYQRTGTILHESNHGVGVGTSSRWWDTELHDGEWKGYRANSLVQFIDNNPSSKMAGDSMHMWPYGINGAHEDSGWPMLYIANVLITQALHEDGLVPPNHGGCKPAYVFEQDDNVKYYITNETSSYGGATAFLTENSNGTLSWNVPEQGAAGDDAYAWYTTFDPARQLYSIRNAKSGRYFTYGSSIKTASKTKPSESEYFHLMVGRTEKVLGAKSTGVKTCGYWIMAGNDVATPLALTASAGGKIASTSFDIAEKASAQRWFILTEDQLAQIQNSAVDANREALQNLVKEGKKLVKVEHSDMKDNVTGDFETLLSSYEAEAPTMDADELKTAIDRMWTGMETFLNGTKLADTAHPYDLTFLVSNPAMDDSNVWNDTPAVSYNCSEFYERQYTMQQTLTGMPRGKYSVRVQAFQRPGSYSDVYSKYANGTLSTTARLQMVSAKSAKIKSIMDGAPTAKVGAGVEQHVGQYYIPDNMAAADAYFSKGLYDNELVFDWEKRADMTVRLYNTTTVSRDWSIFRNFRLYHLGATDREVSVDAVDANTGVLHDVYTIQGVKVDADINSLQPGMYIIDGKAVYKK